MIDDPKGLLEMLIACVKPQSTIDMLAARARLVIRLGTQLTDLSSDEQRRLTPRVRRLYKIVEVYTSDTSMGVLYDAGLELIAALEEDWGYVRPE